MTDTEANKSVGLAERLRAEAGRPRADVWWGNEPFHTVRLADEGLFAEHNWPADVLPQYRDSAGRWVGCGLRARVIAGDSQDVPATLDALAGAAGVALARPTAGTTAGHVAALYELWGDEKADAYFRSLRQGGVTLVAGNGPAAQFAAAGSGRVALTDNDDVANVNRNGDATLRAVLPDQADGGIGTLTIPTTVALVKKPRVSDAAVELADFLASPEAEQMLIDAEFALGSTRQSPESGGIRAMDVDYAAVADRLIDAPRRALDLLEGREPQ